VLTPYDTICVWTIYSYIWVYHSGPPRPFYSFWFKHPNNLAKNTNSRANEFLYINCDHQLFERISPTLPDALGAGEVLHHFQGQCYQLQYKSCRWQSGMFFNVTQFLLNLFTCCLLVYDYLYLTVLYAIQTADLVHFDPISWRFSRVPW
jgi:hypothetical protein